jgi:formiminoglutamase
MTLHNDPNWPRAGAWIRGELEGGALGRLSIIGAPLTRGSITPGRCDLAPHAIRTALDHFSPYDLQHARNLCELAVHDYGDLDVAHLTPEEAFEPVRAGIARAWRDADAVMILGGDNSVTRPGCRALGDRAGLITFDAHFDLRDLDGGLSNGNPIRALLRDGLTGKNIVQIGLQPFANSAAYASIAARSGITVVTVEQVRVEGVDAVVVKALKSLTVDCIYVDLDLDVLDRTFAPATPGSRPGGLTPSEMRRAARLCGLDAKVRAIDFVEIDPQKDISDQTAFAAAACLLSFASGVHERCSLLLDARNL